MSGLCKIGCGMNPQTRLDEANSMKPVTWIPGVYKIEFSIKVFDYEKKERAIHTLLDERNFNTVNPKESSGAREWFYITPEEVKQIFDIVSTSTSTKMSLEDFKAEVTANGINSIEMFIKWAPSNLPSVEDIESGYFADTSLNSIMGWTSPMRR
jgi:hypothetical protein